MGVSLPARDTVSRPEERLTGLELRKQSGTCVGSKASLADEHLRADGRAGMQPVQRLGDPQEPARGVNPVQEAVDQEHHGGGRGAVLHQDGGFQISLEKNMRMIKLKVWLVLQFLLCTLLRLMLACPL